MVREYCSLGGLAARSRAAARRGQGRGTRTKAPYRSVPRASPPRKILWFLEVK